MRCSRVYGPAPRSKLEFDYSLRRKSPDKMIACVMEPACFDTSLWHGAVGMTLGGRLYIDLSKDDDAGFLAGIKKLVDEICKVTDALPPVGDLTLGASPPARLSAYPDLAFTRYAAQKLFHQISLDFPGTQLVREEPYIFLVPDLLTATECDQLIVKLACAEEQQASGNAQQVASGARTSMTAFARNDELPTLRQRLAKLANVAVEQLQPTKLTRYDKGQRFATHTDAMDPPQDWGVAYKQVWEAPARYPNRMVTIFVYLNDCAQLALPPGANVGQPAQDIVAAYARLLIVEPRKDAPDQLHAFLLANPLAVPPFFKSILTDAARANWLHEAVKATPSLAGLTDTDGRRAIDVAYSVCTQAMQAAFFLIAGRSDGLYVPELLVPPLIEEDLWTAYLAAQDDPAFTALLA